MSFFLIHLHHPPPRPPPSPNLMLSMYCGLYSLGDRKTNIAWERGKNLFVSQHIILLPNSNSKFGDVSSGWKNITKHHTEFNMKD